MSTHLESTDANAQPFPERLGRYRLIRCVSTGGMARVYEGRRESLAGVAPRVAIKVILPEHANDAKFQQLFVNEARIGSQLQHQNVVQIQDFDRQGDCYYLVMEYVEGLTFRRAISHCKRSGLHIPLAVIAELGRQMCEGLHYAHTARAEDGSPLHLVHRDIKPSNLLLTAAGGVKLLDFGVARADFTERESSTSSVLMGSYGYMAPERLDGVDGPEGDIYALGVVFYELVVGERLGRTSSNPSRHAGFHQAAIRRFSRVVGDECYEATELLSAMLDYDPAARPSARALETQLRRLIRTFKGESLSEWAERVVPFLRNQHRSLGDGEVDLSGVTLAEQPGGRPVLRELAGNDPETEGFDYENHTFPIDPTPPPVERNVALAVVEPDETPTNPPAEDPPSRSTTSDPPSAPSLEEPRSAPSQPAAAPLEPEPSFLNYVEAARVVRPGETLRDVMVALLALVVVLGVVLWAFAGQLKPKVEAVAALTRPAVEVVDEPPIPQDSETLVELAIELPADAPPAPTGRDAAVRQAEAGNAASQQNGNAALQQDPPPAPPEPVKPPPAPPPAPPKGTVRAEGDPAALRLVGAGGSFPPGKVPAGSYDVHASFDGGAEVNVGRVDVLAGQTVVLRCKKAFVRCQAALE